MTSTTTSCELLLAQAAVSDRCYFEVTAWIAAHFDGEPAVFQLSPQLICDWFTHSVTRVPDFRVWQLSSRIEEFFDPVSGNELPCDWPWDTRDRVLRLNAYLRSRPQWQTAFARAAAGVEEAIRRWFDELLLEWGV